MTDYQPLNSAEEVQRAFAEGRDVEFTCDPSRQFGWITPKMHARKNFAQCLAEGYGYRVAVIPKDTPTPEAERRELHAMAADTGPLTVAALVSAELEAERRQGMMDAELADVIQQHTGCADSDSVYAAIAVRKALSVPAAQDGDHCETRYTSDGTTKQLDEVVGSGYFHLEQMSEGHWSLRLGRHLIGLHSKRAIRADIIENDLPPNAIRGDKGAEAVVEALEWLRVEISAVDPWYRGSPTYLRDGAWMKDRADDLITQAVELFAPTQAAAKEGSNVA